MNIKLSVLNFLVAAFVTAQPITYPLTKKVNISENYFGTTVQDPYRWLEDDNSKETEEWVRKQNELTFGHLDQIPFRNDIKQRITELWNYEKRSAPFKQGQYYFTHRNSGLQNQSELHVQLDIHGESRILLDPNKLSDDGTISLGSLNVSTNGELLAYTISQSGSDWQEIHVMDIATGKKLSDELKWVKFSGIAWHGNGFYYSRYAEPEKGTAFSKKNEFHKVYFHKLGTKQTDDILIFDDKNNPTRNFSAQVTKDERFLIIYETQSTSGNSLHVKDLKDPVGKFIQITKGFDSDYRVIDNLGKNLIIYTNEKAPKYKVMLAEFPPAQNKFWTSIIKESEHVLQSVAMSQGKLVALYMKDVTSKIQIFDLRGTPENEIQLPGIGTVTSINANKHDAYIFYSFTSIITPTATFAYNVQTKESQSLFGPKTSFNSELYESYQVFFPSKDGTSIPMFITHKKGLALDEKNPVLLYGYGGFNISVTSTFATDRLVFLEQGGVLAIPNIRGGGEYGKEWHLAGTKLKKQNVFDDFISAAEYLISQKYTSPKFIAISGRSNGGLLVGAAMTQRPELFKVALPGVGVLDMLRYHKFTIGWAWKTDYGSSEDSVGFQNLISYSPLHNIREGIEYPATLVTTADHDDRVVPAHSFKFISTLQEKIHGKNPALIRVDVKAGHGAGKPVSKQIDEHADVYSFVFHHLGMTYK